MRAFLSNTLAALARNPPKPLRAPEAPPPLPQARPNRRQRRQQELGQRRAQAQTNRALEQALMATKDGDRYTAVQNEPTECHPKTPNDRG